MSVPISANMQIYFQVSTNNTILYITNYYKMVCHIKPVCIGVRRHLWHGARVKSIKIKKPELVNSDGRNN